MVIPYSLGRVSRPSQNLTELLVKIVQVLQGAETYNQKQTNKQTGDRGQCWGGGGGRGGSEGISQDSLAPRLVECLSPGACGSGSPPPPPSPHRAAEKMRRTAWAPPNYAGAWGSGTGRTRRRGGWGWDCGNGVCGFSGAAGVQPAPASLPRPPSHSPCGGAEPHSPAPRGRGASRSKPPGLRRRAILPGAVTSAP